MKCAAFVFEEVFPRRVLESSHSVKRSLFLSTEHDLNPFCQTGEQAAGGWGKVVCHDLACRLCILGLKRGNQRALR